MRADFRVLPRDELAQPAWEIFDFLHGSIEFNMGKDEPNMGFMMHVRASPAVITPMLAMCKSYNLQALDGNSGEVLQKTVDPRGSLKQWIECRNQIVAKLEE